ncbi:hypothetical protein J6590_028347 [Homalodisca vitripennis]|nr:hypothetical protein J6590_028347 [Homalodisca vitripennis]
MAHSLLAVRGLWVLQSFERGQYSRCTQRYMTNHQRCRPVFSSQSWVEVSPPVTVLGHC